MDMLSKDDHRLVAAWKNGNQQAFNELFGKYYRPLCNYAYSFLHDQDAAKDIVQQIFTGMLAGKLHLRLDATIKSYLYAAVHNRCLRELENQKRRKFHLERYAQTSQHTDNQPDNEDNFHNLRKHISELPRQRRVALELFYLEGHKQMEVARKMGIALSSVKTHLHLALATLREKMHNSRIY
ncbi:RNA polymerase sigma factor [Chitinophaga sp. GCM10012297]|uniref:Sigma-70 family RNA polymerase sigma factor n=1 Tax=Chitinophaga chungangae TaxID=2821488 RepID=A0ABS3YJH0_9BACT|nr:sigma-70 family RNA polymerase sigma factor [Chitinophaga chungangae]MBO9154842.1 sigma-70 family RNA polymerase sigma factor [Chitinophaga chungangae]